MNNVKPKPILRKRRLYKKPPGNRLNSNSETTTSPVSSKKQHLKFAGPIKIIVVEPQSEYCKTVWCAIGIGLANVTIGAVNMSILHYSIKSGDAHAVVCSIAYHFFSAEALLSLHYANGWSAPMRLRHRKFGHIFLQLCGIVCAITGTVLVTVGKGASTQTHGITGLITGVLLILSAVIGPAAYLRRKSWVVTLHMSVGIPTFVMSSICVCSGLILKPFKDWAGEKVMYLLIAFVIFYTVFIVTSSFLKCMSRI